MARPLPPKEILYKERFVLRPVEPKDIPKIQEALAESLDELHRFMAWSHYMQGDKQFLERVLAQHASYFKGEEYELALFDQNSGEFLVYTGFCPSGKLNSSCFEIGFWTSKKHRRKGLATLATHLQIVLIFEYFKGDRIEITCNIENQASYHLIEKCGFQYEGELRNFYPKGTPHMYAHGFTKQRRVALFSLIPDERGTLPWYQEVLQAITLVPLLGESHQLQGWKIS